MNMWVQDVLMSHSIRLSLDVASRVCDGTLVAYLDQGSGSFVLQTLMAGFFGLVYSLKRLQTRLKGLLHSNGPEV